MAEPWLIIGLGNPGKQYERTRHNLGFLVIDDLAVRYRVRFSNSSLMNSLVGEAKIDGQECTLLKPMTYMNHSGVSVRKVVADKKIAHENILVVCDDLNLAFGQMRLRKSGSDGGHNGLSSVIQHLCTQDFARLRMGISAPSSKEAAVEYVLEKFNKKEKQELDLFVQQGSECCLTWLKEGATTAMSQFNKKKDEGTTNE